MLLAIESDLDDDSLFTDFDCDSDVSMSDSDNASGIASRNRLWPQSSLPARTASTAGVFFPGIGDRLEALKDGSPNYPTVSSMFKDNSRPRLRPGALSEAGEEELNCLKGSKVSTHIAQCPQRRVTWQVTGGCRTAAYTCQVASLWGHCATMIETL